jgi:hypothetical protein
VQKRTNSDANSQLVASQFARMGERSAARRKSGQSVRQSDPGLRRPTSPATAGRKPAARPPFQIPSIRHSKDNLRHREAGLTQPKTGRGAGQSPALWAQREALGTFPQTAQSDSADFIALGEPDLVNLIAFFRTLDRWDREALSSVETAMEPNR